MPTTVAVTVWVLMAVLGAIVAQYREQSAAEGFALGLLLGPLGVLVVGVRKPPVTPATTPLRLLLGALVLLALGGVAFLVLINA